MNMPGINTIFESSNVERFHAVPGVSPQKISEHSWGVAMLCQYFLPNCSKKLILVALTHDCAELFTGDIPATTKWHKPDIKTLLDSYEKEIESKLGINWVITDEERKLLKLCDALEGMKYCIFRYGSGEKHAKVIFGRWAKHVSETCNMGFREKLYYDSLIQEMSDGS